jgi:dTDP-4-dehydrorhamnose reductase
MIALLGASGYIGSAFAEALQQRGSAFMPVSRAQLDYTRFSVLVDFLRQHQPAFLINAAGFTGKPNVDACEVARAETLHGNVLLPLAIAHACEITGTPWGHVSSGCIYNGAKILRDGQWQVESDLASHEFQKLRRENPEHIRGFDESDCPNFTFSRPPCSFYSGSKALAEKALAETNDCYIWRLRMPFDEHDNPRNYLSKLQRYSKLYENTNSISHRGDFVRACLELWERRAPFGIYNITNPGHVTTREVAHLVQRVLGLERKFEFFSGDAEFYAAGVQTIRSNCILEVKKLIDSGIRLRSVVDALTDSLKRWQKTPVLRAA